MRAPLKIPIYYEPPLILKGLARGNAAKYQLLEVPMKDFSIRTGVGRAYFMGLYGSREAYFISYVIFVANR